MRVAEVADIWRMHRRRGGLLDPARKQEEDKEVEVWTDEEILPVEKIIKCHNVTRFVGHESMASFYSYKSQTPGGRRRI